MIWMSGDGSLLESFFLARVSCGPEIFVSEFFWRQSPGFLALQVEGLLAHIVTVLVTYHTYLHNNNDGHHIVNNDGQ